jgi:hypothetical protein
MSEPLDYQLVLNLQAALRAIAVASGYYATVASVAVKLDADQAVEDLERPDLPVPFIILDIRPETVEYLPAMEIRQEWPIVVHWVADCDPTDDASRVKTFMRGCADVEKAIAQDVTRGGLAVDTRIISRTLDPSVGGSRVWAVIDLRVTSYRTFGQPSGA